MATALEEINEPIIAIACGDKKGKFHFLYCEPSITINDLDFQDDVLLIRDYAFPYNWFNSVTVCTKETLEDFKKELQNT